MQKVTTVGVFIHGEEIEQPVINGDANDEERVSILYEASIGITSLIHYLAVLGFHLVLSRPTKDTSGMGIGSTVHHYQMVFQRIQENSEPLSSIPAVDLD